MRLNNRKIIITNCISETLGDEMILFNEENQKIIVLNQTALFIWNEINRNYFKKTNTTSEKIANSIIKVFNTLEETKENIIKDVEETIEMLIDSSLIVLETDSIQQGKK